MIWLLIFDCRIQYVLTEYKNEKYNNINNKIQWFKIQSELYVSVHNFHHHCNKCLRYTQFAKRVVVLSGEWPSLVNDMEYILYVRCILSMFSLHKMRNLWLTNTFNSCSMFEFHGHKVEDNPFIHLYWVAKIIFLCKHKDANIYQLKCASIMYKRLCISLPVSTQSPIQNIFNNTIFFSQMATTFFHY